MLDFGLVREALEERGLLLTRLAPHLVRPVPFLYPLTTTAGSGRTSAPGSRSTTRMAMAGKYDDGRAAAPAPVPPAGRPDRARPADRGAHGRDPLLRLPGRRRPAGDARSPAPPRRTARTSRPATKVDRLPARGRAGRRRPRRSTSRTAARSRSAPGSWSTPPASGPTRSRRWSAAAARSTSRPARASTSSCRATGSAPRPASSPAPRSRVLFVIPWGRHWIIGTTDTPWDLDKAHPAASPRRHRLRARPRQHDAARAARPRRRRGRVRRAAAAAVRGVRADLEDLPRAHGRRRRCPGW